MDNLGMANCCPCCGVAIGQTFTPSNHPQTCFARRAFEQAQTETQARIAQLEAEVSQVARDSHADVRHLVEEKRGLRRRIEGYRARTEGYRARIARLEAVVEVAIDVIEPPGGPGDEVTTRKFREALAAVREAQRD